MPSIEQWTVDRGRPEEVITSGHTYGLLNTEVDRYVVYGEREWGINLVWRKEFWRAMWFQRQDGQGNPIRYGDRVALAFGYGGEYVRYGQRRWGINLVWSRDPVYEWELTGGPTGTPIQYQDNRFGLFNRTMNDHVVYCERFWGINLSWPSSCDAWRNTVPATEANVTINCKTPLGGIGTGSSFGSVAFTGQVTAPQGATGDGTFNKSDQWEASPGADIGQASIGVSGLRAGIWRIEARTPVWAGACNVQLNTGINEWVNFEQNIGGCARGFQFPTAAAEVLQHAEAREQISTAPLAQALPSEGSQRIDAAPPAEDLPSHELRNEVSSDLTPPS